MQSTRELHPDFQYYLDFKGQTLLSLFSQLRSFILELYPESNELLYHTHALTAVFSVTDKLGDAFCMIPIYTNHLHLGFNKGMLLHDPEKLLVGTGTLIRHIPIQSVQDFDNAAVRRLLQKAKDLAVSDLAKPTVVSGKTISKIKK